MATTGACYISASRRTDLPRFFRDPFFAARRGGEITYDGGYGRRYTVSLRPDDVTGYIFWSKDYSAFLDHRDFTDLIEHNNALFHYTINDCPDLEPRVAPLRERLDTLTRLCEAVGPRRVLWRFDPLLRYRLPGERTIREHARQFFDILPAVSRAGVTRCYFSFATRYHKLSRRPLELLDFVQRQRVEIAASMQQAAAEHGITLHTCCNPDIPRTVAGIRQAHCVDDDLLARTDRFGVHRSLKHKPTRSGCGCFESRDIGSYTPPCPHGCLYCYANPASDSQDRRRK